jgi:hypothetical protein
MAQNGFITAAENMGIPPVHWERSTPRKPLRVSDEQWGGSDNGRKLETLTISTRDSPLQLVPDSTSTLPSLPDGRATNNILKGGGDAADSGALVGGVTKLLNLMGSSRPQGSQRRSIKADSNGRLHARDWKVVVTL